ncbi:MAG TPA: hypothetical protein VLB68_31135 [Pyrinomonadaceae bacterium]|nr:hypothetical protein [Pyrinomonadaceae bacterium]
MRTIYGLIIMISLATCAYAQRPRSIEPDPAQKPAVAPAPKTVKAKYEGGIFGYRQTMEGTLTFDDANNQLLFKDKKTPKQLHIPYAALTSAFADTQKRQPGAASVASQVPLIYTLPARFIKTKVRYLTLQFNDPDSQQAGITSFKLENKEILESVLVTLAEKTGMTLRGDIYVKKKEVSKVGP